MNLPSASLSIKIETREILSVFGNRTLTFSECRRAATVAGCDLRASSFSDVFSDIIAAGFVAEVKCGKYCITAAGSAALERGDPECLPCSVDVRTRNANDSLVQRRHGFERELIFGEYDIASAPLCLERVTLHTGEECVPHSHLGTHTVVYTLRGKVRLHYGPNLEKSMEIGPEDCVYIPPGVVHWVVNEWAEPMTAVVARTAARHDVLEYPHLRSEIALDGRRVFSDHLAADGA